jgi:hypothetical protein
MQRVRDVVRGAAGDELDQAGAFNPSKFCSIAEDVGIEFPGSPISREEPEPRARKILGRSFRESEGQPVSLVETIHPQNGDGLILEKPTAGTGPTLLLPPANAHAGRACCDGKPSR